MACTGFRSSLSSLLCLGLLLLLLLLATLGCLLGLAAASDEETDYILGCDEAVVIDLELAEDVVDLGLGELVSPRLEGVREHRRVDLAGLLALALVGAEGADD